MKKLILSLLLFSIALFLFSQTEAILSEGFEGAFPSGLWNLSGNPTWDDENYRSNSGNWAAWCAGSGSLSPSNNQYANGMNAEMVYGPFSLSGASTARLYFSSKVSTEPNYDYFKVIVHYYSGGRWRQNEIHSQDGTDGNYWQSFEYSLNEYTGNDRVKVAFVFTSDGSNTSYEGAWVDDIRITKGGTSSIPLLDFSTSEISLGRSLNHSTDANWFRFYGNAGRTYTIYSSGSMDTKAYIYEDDGSTELASDDDSGENTNFSLSFTPSSSRYYRLKVIGYNGATGSYTLNYNYRGSSPSTNLSISTRGQNTSRTLNYENEEHWYSFRGEGGRTYVFYTQSSMDTQGTIYESNNSTEIVSDDDGGDETNFRLEFTPNRTADYRLKINGYNGATGSYTLYYNYISETGDGFEPNNSHNQATSIEPRSSNQSLDLTLHNGDEDWFRFRGTANTTYYFNTSGNMDTRAYLYNDNGTSLIMEDDDGGDGTNFSFNFTPSRTAFYKIKIVGYNGATGSYRLNFNR